MSDTLDLEEIQGLIVSGYGERPTARYALFAIVDAPRARRWLKELLPTLQFSEYRRSRRGQPPFLNPLCVNIAFTHAGFAALGLPRTALVGFSLPFQEGIADPDRARRLGDDGPSAPERWSWGRPGEPLHGVLAVFAGVDDADPEEWRQIDTCILSHMTLENGVRALSILDTMPANRLLRKEHFGFRDGIANPRLKGLSRASADDVIADGEVLLGYENGYGRLPLSPELAAEADPAGILPRSSERSERRDFGRNGSYLVFRQLEQDVRGFWQYVHDAKRQVPDAPADSAGDDWLAAKMVGRWRNGTSLTRYPEQPGPEDQSEDNRFLFAEHGDAFGARCPIGSHIRRTNPRDTGLPVPHDPELSHKPLGSTPALKLADLHRIMRRGRPYGDPLDPHYDPERMRLSAEGEGGARGVHFLCFNANLSRQFEFVQSNWALNPCFAGLSSDPDPLLGAGRQFPFPAADFTIPGLPVRRVHGLPRVVEVRGGAYFFMPSKSALRYLSEL